MAEETMDVEKQVDCLNTALRLQHRSVLHYSLVAGSVIGREFQAHADKMRKHALSELEDATRLVEKITALGGEPTTDVAPISFVPDSAKALDELIECEAETLETLQTTCCVRAADPKGVRPLEGGRGLDVVLLECGERVRRGRVHAHVGDLPVAHPPDPPGRAGHSPAAR